MPHEQTKVNGYRVKLKIMFHVEHTENKVPSVCVVCDNKDVKFLFKVRDHFLSGETFSLFKCNSCGLISTFPAPDENHVASYYKSEKYISHSSSPASFFEFLYQGVRHFTLNRKAKLTLKYAHGKKLLDIGCATGEYLQTCRKKGFEVFGIEPNQKAREIAFTNHGLIIEDLDGLNTFKPGTFDAISMWHVLEHVHDINERMIQLNRLLKEDGVAIIALPNSESYDAAHYKEIWAAYDVPRHLYHFNKSAFKTLAEKHEFKVRNILPMKFDAYYVSLLSEKYKNGKGSPIKAFLTGLRSNIKAKMKQGNYSSLIYVISKN